MASKKNKYILMDLAWCESKLKEWQADVDKHPFDKLEDRWGYKTTAKGGVTHLCVATVEQQKASFRATLKDIMEILPRINELREEEDKKKDIKLRGDEDLPEMMQ